MASTANRITIDFLNARSAKLSAADTTVVVLFSLGWRLNIGEYLPLFKPLPTKAAFHRIGADLLLAVWAVLVGRTHLLLSPMRSIRSSGINSIAKPPLITTYRNPA